MKSLLRPLVIVVALLVAIVAAGCGSSSSSTSTAASAGSSKSSSGSGAGGSALGTPKKASGSPVVFGLLNIESGPVTFPEYRQAAEAAAQYVNNYQGGIGGRPIKIVSCATDGQPATSARCASQMADQKPVAILGGADTGAPGAFAVYKRKDLAYVGGIPFTPVESNAPNATIFISISTGDNAAAVKYAAQSLGVKKASVIYTDDTQGKFTGLGVIVPAMKKSGITVKAVPVAPNAADLTSVAASAIGGNPDLVYVNSPNACPGLLKALKSVGYSGKLMGIDPCSSPPALQAAGSSAEGLYFAQPFQSPDSGTPDAKVFLAAVQKYAPKTLALDSIAEAGFSSVVNLQKQLSPVGADKLNTASIEKTFKSASGAPNFLAHPYTCNGKQIPGATAVCNAYQLMKQVKSGKVTTVDGKWITGADLVVAPKG
jgi:branched-chain amino acid transport system substrate-binding protein